MCDSIPLANGFIKNRSAINSFIDSAWLLQESFILSNRTNMSATPIRNWEVLIGGIPIFHWLKKISRIITSDFMLATTALFHDYNEAHVCTRITIRMKKIIATIIILHFNVLNDIFQLSYFLYFFIVVFFVVVLKSFLSMFFILLIIISDKQ